MKLIISGNLMGYNRYIGLNRHNKYGANNAKKNEEKTISSYIKICKIKPITEYPVILKIDWYEKDKRRDYDNVVSAKKFLLDALVNSEILKDDSRKYIIKIDDDVYVDKDNPRIEVEFMNEFDFIQYLIKKVEKHETNNSI